MQPNHNATSTRRGRIQRPALMMLLTLTSMLPVTGCVTRVRNIDPSTKIVTVRAGVPFTPPVDGKFVPEARFDEMRDVYIRHSFEP